jgi:hypothetical protein
MPDIKDGFFQYLQSLASVTAALGSSIFPDTAPQGTAFPYMTYYIQDEEKTRTLLAASALSQDTFTLSIYAESSESRSEVKEVLRNALYGRKNVDFQATGGNLRVRSISWLGSTDTKEAPTDNSEQVAFVSTIDLFITWVEPVPTLP